MANRRCPVMGLFHGVGGAAEVGSGILGPSSLPRRAMALMADPALPAALPMLSMPAASASWPTSRV
ncbi:hypothetical protein [Mycolicibacterium mucogenicum]|uniref:hypothetical protein n=1 Tax=Mycolicibacterium mucogenicum TaxID=56689 RepID=UPI002B41625E|nr:hypothetical protein [Mycolicibacterium mucogenicum]